MEKARPSRKVACHFCRVRKLKCSRSFPCSNCTSRGVSCPASSGPVPIEPAASPGLNNPEILSRLERVEALLAARADTAQLQLQPAAAISLPSPATTSTSSLSSQQHQHQHQHQHQQYLPPRLQNLVEDVVVIHQSARQKIPSDTGFHDIIIRTCPIHLFTQLSLNDFYNPEHPSANKPRYAPTYIWLPTQPETDILVDKYFSEVGYAHSILHGPSTRSLVAELYSSLQAGSQPTTGPVVLLLSILAAVGHFWTPCNQPMVLFSNNQEANAQGTTWTEMAFSLFEISQKKSSMSLEHLQALVLLTVVIVNLDGITSRTYSTFCKAITMGRELGLHIIDNHQNRLTSDGPPPLTGLRAEAGRRAWWHLVATDWILSCCSGPQKGTYSINPYHMAVKRPSNINDEDFGEGEIIARPIEQPTSMSFFLQRLQLADLIRLYTDKVPLVGFDPYTVGYDHILELDGSIERYIQQMPPFFYKEESLLEGLAPGNPQSMILQRYLLTFMIHGQRCRLHLPYFARGSVDPTYGYSKKVSLRSAWIMINAEHKLRQENYLFASARMRMGAVMYGYFVAVVILVLDLCQASNEAEQAIKRQQVTSPWMILEEAQADSPLVLHGVETLRRIMEKYNVGTSNGMEMEARAHNMSGTPHGMQDVAHSSANPRACLPRDFSQQGGGLELGKELENIDWDGLLWVSDAPFL